MRNYYDRRARYRERSYRHLTAKIIFGVVFGVAGGIALAWLLTTKVNACKDMLFLYALLPIWLGMTFTSINIVVGNYSSSAFLSILAIVLAPIVFIIAIVDVVRYRNNRANERINYSEQNRQLRHDIYQRRYNDNERDY